MRHTDPRIIGAAALGAAGLAWLAVAIVGGPQRPPAPPTSSPPVEDGPPPVVSAERAARYREGQATIAQAIRRLKGRDPTPAELYYTHAVTWLETRDGKGWKGPLADAHNWGAVQCSRTADPAQCITWEDSRSDGTKYTVSFRRYDSDLDGATDAARNVLQVRPRTAAMLASQSPTVTGASLAMRRERYYEGFCPLATKRYGGPAVRPSLREPDRDEMTRACAKEAIEAHAGSIWRIVREIAVSLGESPPLERGTYAGAVRAYGLPDVSGILAGVEDMSGTEALYRHLLIQHDGRHHQAAQAMARLFAS